MTHILSATNAWMCCRGWFGAGSSTVIDWREMKVELDEPPPSIGIPKVVRDRDTIVMADPKGQARRTRRVPGARLQILTDNARALQRGAPNVANVTSPHQANRADFHAGIACEHLPPVSAVTVCVGRADSRTTPLEPDMTMTRTFLLIRLTVATAVLASASAASAAGNPSIKPGNSFALVTMATGPGSRVVPLAPGPSVAPKAGISNPQNVPLFQNAGSLGAFR